MEHFIYVSQQSYPFEGTVRENILTASLDSDDGVFFAAKKASSHDFIMSFSNGI